MIIENYSFNSATREITFSDYTSIRLEGVKIITNLVSGTMIYQFNESTLLGSVAGNVLTLDYDTTSMSNLDSLMIIYEDVTLTAAEQSLEALVTQSELLADLVATMKQIRKHLEPSATQDSVQRQRVVVESLTGINSQVGAANITQINTLVGGQNAPGQGTGVVQTVWESPVEQRWRVMDAARLNSYLQRQNITFS